MTLAGALLDFIDGQLLGAVKIDLLVDNGAFIEVDVALFESPPILLSNDLICAGLFDVHVGQVFKSSDIKLSFLFISHVGQVEQLAID